MTEDQLLHGCRQGDAEAQRELYALTSDRVYRVLLRMVRNPDDAFDLAQNTFLRVFTHIQGFHGQSSLSTWVYRIAVNEALQFLRSRVAQLKLVRNAAEEAPREARVLDSDLQMDMQAALDRLPEFERALVVLRYFEQMSYSEIAAVLERPEGTIGSGLNRARALLKAELECGTRDDEEVVRRRHPTS